MATIGLDRLYYSKITENENGEETYDTPVSLAKAITAELSVELAEATLYADDGAAEVVKEFQSGTLTLGVADIGVAAAEVLTGATLDDNKVLISASEEYQLILTTIATKEIAKRYGGLENLRTKLMKTENFEMALDEVVWLITLLANQSILIHNLKNMDKQELLTEEAVELLTSPLELAAYKDAIMEAMFKGTKRNVESEDDLKNTPAG